mgnify:CR=1 FL=1
MLQLDLSVEARTISGKGAARTLRREGMTPAVLYGSDSSEAQPLTVNTKAFTKTLVYMNKRHAVLNLEIDGGKNKKSVIIKEIQVDPIRDSIIHADFLEVSLDTPTTLQVPLKIIGKPKGVEMGGEMELYRRDIGINGKLLDIPDYIDVDVSELGIGDSIDFQSLDFPEGVTLDDYVETVFVSVVDAAKKAALLEAAEEAEGEEAAEGIGAEESSEEVAGEESSESEE